MLCRLPPNFLSAAYIQISPCCISAQLFRVIHVWKNAMLLWLKCLCSYGLNKNTNWHKSCFCWLAEVALMLALQAGVLKLCIYFYAAFTWAAHWTVFIKGFVWGDGPTGCIHEDLMAICTAQWSGKSKRMSHSEWKVKRWTICSNKYYSIMIADECKNNKWSMMTATSCMAQVSRQG